MTEKLFASLFLFASLYALKKPLERLKRLFNLLGYAKVFNVLRGHLSGPRLLKS